MPLEFFINNLSRSWSEWDQDSKNTNTRFYMRFDFAKRSFLGYWARDKKQNLKENVLYELMRHEFAWLKLFFSKKK